LADPNTRQGKRTPVTLKIKFKSETLEQFIERYAVDVSQGGIFIRTKEPLAVGTQMKFEFQLRDASPLIAGEGTVVWTRENDPSRPAIAPGMGVRFDRLADGSQTVLERILAEKAKQAPSRGNEGPTKPPMFTDTPTKVAPAPVQEALGLNSRRAKSDSEQTPLPPPRPFHSDADDFDEKAFEEATKVRSLDELAAQTAGLVGAGSKNNEEHASDDAPTNTAIATPPDELAARRGGRADSTVEPPAATAMDRESAPGLPEPPARTPSRPPLDSPAIARTKSGEPVARTKLGIEPAKASTRAAAESVPRAVSSHEPSIPVAPKRPSSAPVLILLLVLVAGGAGAVWWFVLRENVAQEVAKKDPVGSAGSAMVTNPDGSGSAGSSVAINQDGSGGSAGNAAVEAPKGPIVDTVIASSVAKNSTVEIDGTDQKGPAPFTAKLEKDKTFKARVSAPGYATQEIEIKGGQDKQTVKLVLKPRVITVTTEPAGADIYVDSVNTQKITPSEVQLSASQAAKSKVRVSLRRPGYRPVDQSVEAGAFKDSDDKMTASITVKLSTMPRNTGGGNSGGGTTGGGTTGGGTTAGSGATGGGSGSATTPAGGGTGSGSATTPSGGGTGSATTPSSGTGTGSATKPAGSGTGSATTPPAGGGGAGSAAKPSTGSGAAPTGGSLSGTATPSASSGEPEPSWTK
jgi:uncharacterized protein (TIGR02266 family)